MDYKEIIDSRIVDILRGVCTGIPAKVLDTSLYKSECVITVQPSIEDVSIYDNLGLSYPVIQDVPVLIYSGGGAFITPPIQVGDTVYLLFSQRNIENWKMGDTREISTPSDTRAYHLNDAVAFPCIYQKTKNVEANPDDLELKYNGANIKLEKGGNVSITTTKNVNVKAEGNVKIDAPNTEFTGNVRIGGGVSVAQDVQTDIGISLNTHTHTGNLGAPTSPPLAG